VNRSSISTGSEGESIDKCKSHSYMQHYLLAYSKESSKAVQEKDPTIDIRVYTHITTFSTTLGACEIKISMLPFPTKVGIFPTLFMELALGEVRNVPYVLENGAGVFCKSPKEIGNIVAHWYDPKSLELKQMSENALKLAQPNVVFDIVRDLDDLIR
ncbi:hypothetical protein KI387_000898, partial [Taxus chinensis]